MARQDKAKYAQGYKQLLEAFAVACGGPAVVDQVLSAVAAILHVGQLPEGASPEHLDLVARLLQTPADLLQQSLCAYAGSDWLTTATLDRFAQALYVSLCNFVLATCNEALPAASSWPALTLVKLPGQHEHGSDAFGRFALAFGEELARHILTETLLARPQQRFVDEGLVWTPVPYRNDSTVYQAMHSSLLNILTTSVRRATTAAEQRSTALALMQEHNPGIDGLTLLDAAAFSLRHGGLSTAYELPDLVATNLSFNVPLAASQESSASPILCTLADLPLRSEELAQWADATMAWLQPVPDVHVLVCIKANDTFAACQWDDASIARQLGTYQVLPVASVFAAGFAHALPYRRFVERFRALLDPPQAATLPARGAADDPRNPGPLVQLAQELLTQHRVPPELYRLGPTVVFCSRAALATLTEALPAASPMSPESNSAPNGGGGGGGGAQLLPPPTTSQAKSAPNSPMTGARHADAADAAAAAPNGGSPARARDDQEPGADLHRRKSSARGRPVKFRVVSEDDHLGNDAVKYSAINLVEASGNDFSSSCWALPNGVSGQGFVIAVEENVAISRIDLRNTGNNEFGFERGTRAFMLEYSSDQQNWAMLCKAQLPSARGAEPWTRVELARGRQQIPWHSIYLRPGTTARFLRFTALSFYGKGAGLNSIRIVGDQAGSPLKYLRLATSGNIVRLVFFLREVVGQMQARVLSRENALYFRALSAFHTLMADYYYMIMSGTALPTTFAMTAFDLLETFKHLLRQQFAQDGMDPEADDAARILQQSCAKLKDILTQFYSQWEEHAAEVTRMLVQHRPSTASLTNALSVQGHAYEMVADLLDGVYCAHCSGLIWMLEPRYSCTKCRSHAHVTCAGHTAAACVGHAVPQPQPSPNRLFGVRLTELPAATPAAGSPSARAARVPAVLESCIRRLEEQAVHDLDLYRRSCEPSRLHAIKAGGSGADLSFLEREDSRTLSAVVKTWLRELPEPLLTHEAYDSLIDAVDIPNDSKRLGALHRIISRLPKANLAAFELLVSHLTWVARRVENVKIETYTLSLIFGPAVLRPPPDKPVQLLKAVAVLDCFIRQHIKKIESTWADIQALAVACNTLHKVETAPDSGQLTPGVASAEKEISALFAFLSKTGQSNESSLDSKLAYLEDRRAALVAGLSDITPYKPLALCDSIRSAASLVGTNIPPAPLDTHELAKVHRVSVTEWDKPLPHVSRRWSQSFERSGSDPDMPQNASVDTATLAAQLADFGVAQAVPVTLITEADGTTTSMTLTGALAPTAVDEVEEEEELERAPSPELDSLLDASSSNVPVEVGAIFAALRQKEQWPAGPKILARTSSDSFGRMYSDYTTPGMTHAAPPRAALVPRERLGSHSGVSQSATVSPVMSRPRRWSFAEDVGISAPAPPARQLSAGSIAPPAYDTSMQRRGSFSSPSSSSPSSSPTRSPQSSAGPLSPSAGLGLTPPPKYPFRERAGSTGRMRRMHSSGSATPKEPSPLSQRRFSSGDPDDSAYRRSNRSLSAAAAAEVTLEDLKEEFV